MTEELMQLLRESTTEEHRAVEEAFDLANAVKTRANYLSTLERFYQVFAPAEKLLSEWEVWRRLGLQEKLFARSDALARDIRFLGGQPLKTEPASLESFDPLESIDTGDGAIGCAYVLQGSRLGGLIIAKQVRNAQSLTRRGVEFFGGNRPLTAATWREFAQAVNSLNGVDSGKAVLGAKATFNGMLHTFRQGVTTRG